MCGRSVLHDLHFRNLRSFATVYMGAMELSREPISIPQLLKSGKFLHVAAPMVRFSKLPFRLLCRKYDVDIAYTPMITSKEFLASPKARTNEFSTNPDDNPVVVQFAANNALTLARAAEYVVGQCSGIDINCGCPQRWAIKQGYGCSLLENPELVQDMLRQVKAATNIPCSIKIRIDHRNVNILAYIPFSYFNRKTLELARRAEHAGAEWIAVHGRTPLQSNSDPINYEVVRLIRESVSIPIFGNGNCFSKQDAEVWKEKTGVAAVMAARGLLKNPAFFLGFESTPRKCVEDFVNLVGSVKGITTHCFHQHIGMMLHDVLSRAERIEYQTLRSAESIIDFLCTRNFIRQDQVGPILT